ncbi:MAG: short-chain fatty acid transporter [Acidobacteria bacterium]|jgi:short-chain fatty acids transporter|nr:short-chain fatty acid transporter [Acidobacteriota bacterium]|tara:strand:- start:2039 stop:3427 length:1389 start_codon:yes stop_codon:yes gene_type:complete
MSSIIRLVGNLGDSLSRFTQRWIPDSWVVCMMLTVLAMLLAVAGAGAGVNETVLAWGGGMWSLLTLAMQFTIAMIAAHACVSSGPAFRFLDWLASRPDVERPVQAVVLLGLYSIIIAYFNWAASVVASALFVPFIARRNPKADIRLLIAAAYLGMGTVWHGGLSGSAPLIMATSGNPITTATGGNPALVDRLYPVTETLFNAFNLTYLVIVAAVGLGMVAILHPRQNARTLTPEEIDRMMPVMPTEEEPTTPAASMEAFRGWTLLAVVLIGYPLGHSIVTQGFGASWTINAYNAVFLIGALLLQGSPANLVRAFANGARTASGVILQFPFYAGIFGVINGTGLGDWLGDIFVTIATTETYPLIVYVYSGIVNVFVPSGGSKWLIEAPYLLPAARELAVSPTTTVLAYAYGDSTSNLIQPFWAIPILTVTRMKFGDVLGYTGLVALALFAVTVIAMFLIPPML